MVKAKRLLFPSFGLTYHGPESIRHTIQNVRQIIIEDYMADKLFYCLRLERGMYIVYRNKGIWCAN